MALILALDMSGQPSRWLMIEEAITYQARRMVAWSLGRTVATYHGGISRATGERSVLTIGAYDGRAALSPCCP